MPGEKKQKIYISGMRCVSCEAVIAEEIKKINGVKKVDISHRTGTAEIYFDGPEFNFIAVKEAVNKNGYSASLEPIIDQSQPPAPLIDWVLAVLIFLGLILMYEFFKSLGWLKFLSLQTGEGSLSAAFLIGVVASLSSCLAIVGSVVISFASKYKNAGNFYQSNVKPHLLFHAGRMAVFFFLGGLLGLLGDWLKISNNFLGWFTVIVAMIIFMLGLNILGLAPSITKFGIHLPKKTLAKWRQLTASNHVLAPLLLGGLTFFLPCGFTQSMQLFAITTGSFWLGGLSLLLFALGTAPVLIGLGVATTTFEKINFNIFKKVAGLIIIVFAIYTFLAGLALAGIVFNRYSSVNNNKISTNINNSDSEEQVINMVVDYNGYTPDQFNLKKGAPVKWVIDAQQLTGCSNTIIVPTMNISKRLSSGQNIIRFTPEESGVIGFSCSMGMIRGRFIVN